MVILFDGPVQPDDLTTFIREVPVPNELTLLRDMPVRFVEDNTVDFAEIVRTNRTARYRSFDGRVHVSRRDAGSEKRVKLLPLSTSLEEGEYERLQRTFARLQGGNPAALEQAAYNDSENLTREVQNRLEQAWGDVYADGKLTIAENGFAGEADFGVPGTHLVAPSVAWTAANKATMTPLSDIETWSDVYLATNGFRPARMKTSLIRIRAVTRSDEVINAIKGAQTGVTRISLAELNDFLAGEGLPVFDDAYETSVDVDGATTRVIADDKVVFLPPDLAQLGYTAFGVSATALELVNSGQAEMSFEEAAGIVGVIFKEDGVPFRQYTYVDAVAMPILANARRLLVADVA